MPVERALIKRCFRCGKSDQELPVELYELSGPIVRKREYLCEQCVAPALGVFDPLPGKAGGTVEGIESLKYYIDEE